MGRSAGKSLGEEIDRARTLKRYDRSKKKKAEIEKRSSVQCVRQLWKMAQGEAPTDAIEGAEGATPSPGPVDISGMTQEEARAAGGVPAGPRVVAPSGAQTPEDLARSEAMAQLEQEMMADEMAEQSAADHYKQVAEESQAQAQEATMAAQEAQQAADQATQQAQMSQQQADAATQQLQMQSQQDAAEKQQLNEEALGARQNIMQMRQAMTSYRENLQQLALQDPTAMAGPSPEEQGMGAPGEEQGATPGQLQSMMADQQMQKEEEQAAQGKPPPGTPAPPPSAAPELAAAGGATPPAPKKPAPKKEKSDSPKVEVNVEKKSSAIPELLQEKTADFTRAVGAMLGAAGGAGIQSLSDRKGPRGVSGNERVLKSRLQRLQRKPSKNVFDKHMITMTRALADTAKINRQHPGSAAAMAAISGAIAGATVAPTVAKVGRGMF
jgi:hypothetical protein